MIFEVSPELVSRLEAKPLVELMRRLLYVEAQKAGVLLRGVSVPLNITAPDGGEDARISWVGGAEQTDYLPSRFCIFQSKAKDPGAAGWKKEVWTKVSRKKKATRKLNEAITTLLANKGSYIGFTGSSLVGSMPAKCIKSIKDGIVEAGGDPTLLASIEIYDANKIAAWASRHPSVAVWLNQAASGLPLGGFRTLDSWTKQGGPAEVQLVEDVSSRYFLEGSTSVALPTGGGRPVNDAIAFEQAKERVLQHLDADGHSVRVIGPSGIGKSRFVAEVFRDVSNQERAISAYSAVYCDFREIGSQHLLQVVTSLVVTGSQTIVIVDECPRNIASQLADKTRTDGSQLRLITIDIDDRPFQSGDVLNVTLAASEKQLIEGIVRQRLEKPESTTVDYIVELCGGYPRIAVLATENFANNAPVLKSIDDVVERVLDGCGVSNQEHRRAFETLCLFETLGSDEELSSEFDLVSESLAGLPPDRVYEYLAELAGHHIVERRGRFFIAQPAPIANFLGARRLDRTRVSTLLKFIEVAPPKLLTSFFKRWRYFDRTRVAPIVAERLMRPDAMLGSVEALNDEETSRAFDSLVHVVPDLAADILHRLFKDMSTDDLKNFGKGRRHIVWALEKLCFRKETFANSARLLMRLAAAENESWGNNATGQFKQLFQLQLSGTEAVPADRFAVLDEGLSSDDDSIVNVCLDALHNTLDRSHFSRASGAEQIGSGPPLKDWAPRIWGEVFSFHRDGLKRVEDIWTNRPGYAERCEKMLSSHLRSLISENLLDDVVGLVERVVEKKGIWLEAIEGLGDWLYFDGTEAPSKLTKRITQLYAKLLPTDLVDQALLYTKFWAAEIRDPDARYNRESNSPRDYEYSTRKALDIAKAIAPDPMLVERAITAMAGKELNNAFAFARELGLHINNPDRAVALALDAYEGGDGKKTMQFIRGLLNGIDAKDEATGTRCIKAALEHSVFKSDAVGAFSSVKLTADRLREITEMLKGGKIEPASCSFLSYGRGLDHFSSVEIAPFIDELSANHGPTGVWTALEVISMYLHGRTTLDPQLEIQLKDILTSARLLDKPLNISRDGYVLETLVEHIHEYGTLDEAFVVDLAAQIVRLCQIKDYEVFHALDSTFAKIVSTLVKAKPVAIWNSISRFYEVATPIEKHQLDSLLGTSGRGEAYLGAGVLFDLKESILVDWAREAPENRVGFLCDFYPLLVDKVGGGKTWHPAFERLAVEFGEFKSFRQQAFGRLRPSSWWGSMVPFLEVFLEPLESWFEHQNTALAQWSRETYRSLRRQIDWEKKRDGENL